MRRLRAAVLRFAAFFCASRREREMREEMESHLALQIEENLRCGMKPEEARRQAVLQSGGIAQALEEYRHRSVLPWMETTLKDLIYGLRQMRRSPGFSAAVILLLALGIGANTALFSFLNGMLRPLPVSDPASLVVLKWHAQGDPPVKRSHSRESHTEDDKGYVTGNFPYRFTNFSATTTAFFRRLSDCSPVRELPSCPRPAPILLPLSLCPAVTLQALE
jgi:hypothetical protein